MSAAHSCREMKKARKAPPRTRRTAEDARTAILDAAEQRLVASGPKGIRLQDVAADVGISHPTVLHHFGSRERLVDEVLKRRVEAMNREVIVALAGGGDDLDSARALFERLYAALGPGGHARVTAFLALEGRVPGAEPHSLRPLAELTHAERLSRCIAGGPRPTFDDSYFIVLLSAFALFGEAIVGPLFRGEPEGAPDEETSKRFRFWLAQLVLEHLKAPNAPP
ncbi:MAG: Transcriptional regulator, TetR family protein [Myxococcaceae bacterium]|nr:Transcriptional regulator, TetR family protein [Myxococcaceae bacterium]